ncbi:SGNH/GDSL hydrolase family protein [Lichenifustis flavocetrariae]|uniref:SGNH/GDSL hydrolase family protein n=1 Tax=Lichenifustis flavocetrariae TaxID=2949735 RepID=A0AA41YZ19_9HYPH|nr:SGNH/GDSL hydrolase family protein [Lichenifustis flavocetrariae]MCW6509926.1 SGNH/GDSL hydrolase family protein [Lichenifustis flavocetrariae]
MKTIVCFGDSNSYGTPPMPHPDFWGRFGPDERWPGVMRRAVGADITAIEEALPGRTTVHDDPIEGADRNGLKALPMVLGSHRPIDLLIINLGTNDLKARFSVTADDIAASVGVLVRFTQASQAGPNSSAPKVLVVAPAIILETSFFREYFQGGAEKSRGFARAFGAMATRLGVPLLDAASLITSDPLDGIHLDPSQHAILGQALAEKVRTILT